MLAKYLKFHLYNASDNMVAYDSGGRVELKFIPWKFTSGAMAYGSEVDDVLDFEATDEWDNATWYAGEVFDNSTDLYMGAKGTLKITINEDASTGYFAIYLEESTDNTVWPSGQADYDPAEDLKLVAIMQISGGDTDTRATNFEIGGISAQSARAPLKFGTIARNALQAKRPYAWQGLVGFWSMLEGGGDTVYDLSGQGNNGTITSAAGDITWIPNGVHFAGTDNNDQIDCGNASSLQAGEITYVTRVRFTDLTNNDYMIGCKGDSNDGWYLEVNGGALLRLVARYNWSGGSGWLTGDSSAVTADTWYNIAMSQGGGFCRIYLDGVLHKSTAISGTMDNPGAMALYLGRYVSSENYELVGDMEYSLLYNRALTAAEISQMSALGRAYWLERQMFPYSYEAAGGTILPQMMQLCA